MHMHMQRSLPPPRRNVQDEEAHASSKTGVIGATGEYEQGAIQHNMARLTFPERVLGKSGTMYIFFGAANGPMTLRTCSTSSFASAASLLVS
jgi:hypothetical protein